MAQYDGYTVRYENNRGESVTLTEHPYYLNIENLFDYQWSYSVKEKRRGSIIAGFRKDITSKSVILHVIADTVEERNEAIDKFNNVIDADIYDGRAGKLWVNDWFTYTYVIQAKNTNWQYGVPVVKKELNFAREQDTWFHVIYRNSYSNPDPLVPWQYGIKDYEQTRAEQLITLPTEGAEYRGITYSLSDNGIVIADGTASSYSDFSLGEVTLEAGDYVLFGCPDVEGVSLRAGNYEDTGEGVLISLAQDTTLPVSIHIGNVTVDNLKIQPVLAAGDTIPDIGYDYPYDYGLDLKSQIWVENPNPMGCNWIINIMGPCENPEVEIGGTIVKVNVVVPDGAYLTVDTTSKTATVTTADGSVVNVFGARDPDYYLFQLIDTGRSAIMWDGAFRWDLEMIEERSEPRWHSGLI